MDFEFSEEHRMFKDSLERVNREKIEPLLASYPKDDPLPREACERIRELLLPFGIHGARVPEEYGGSGLGAVGLGIAAETLPYEAFELMICIEIIALRMCLGGSQDMKRKYLPRLMAGEKFGASATSEPDVGSDPRGVRTRAELRGDTYVLNGTKIWVSAGSVADYLLVVASTGKDDKGKPVITPFFVDTAQSPVEVRHLDLMGIRQSHICEIFLDNVSIPSENMFSEAQGHAHRVLTASWLGQRAVVGLYNIRLAERAYEAALQYAKERVQFGRPIAGFQSIQNTLAEMRALIDASKLLCYRALCMSDKGQRPDVESSLAKFFSCEAALKVTNAAIEVHGAFGITKEFAVEKYFRDARVLAFPDGTIGIQKLIVGREITGIRAFS
ncbi:MAG: acyl-CoA dehydrogenase family protein [Pseudomonadota bacterium]